MHAFQVPGRWSASLMVAALLCSTLSVPAAAAEAPPPCGDVPARAFLDVPVANVHANNIDCVAARGVVRGTGGGNYAPGGAVTRGHMATFLVNLVEVATDQPRPAPLPAAFRDVAGTMHHHNILIARQLGIARGVTASTYAPGRAVSRAQMATFVAQAITASGGSLPTDPPDAFGDDDGSVHEPNIDALAAAGIIVGTGGGRYDPEGPVRRDQMATFLANAARYLHGQGRWGGYEPEELDEDTDEEEVAEVVAPALVSVARAGDGDDVIDLHWSVPVAVVDPPGAFRVLLADGVTLVAQGAALSAPDGNLLQVTLTGGLDAGVTYWLSLPHGAVRAADDADNVSDVHAQAFVFGTADADGGDDGGSGDGGSGDGGSGDGGTGDDGSEDEVVALPLVTAVAIDGSDVESGGSITVQNTTPTLTGVAAASGSTIQRVEYRIGSGDWTEAVAVDGTFDSTEEAFDATLPALAVATHEVAVRARAANGLTSGLYVVTIEVGALVPTVTSVVTDPENDRLVVTFSDPVVCPNRPNTRAAFWFTNDGSGESAELLRGHPDEIASHTSSSDTCSLIYTEKGIHPEDRGVLSYSQPAATLDRVMAVDGAALESFVDVPVTNLTP